MLLGREGWADMVPPTPTPKCPLLKSFIAALKTAQMYLLAWPVHSQFHLNSLWIIQLKLCPWRHFFLIIPHHCPMCLCSIYNVFNFVIFKHSLYVSLQNLNLYKNIKTQLQIYFLHSFTFITFLHNHPYLVIKNI